jgi:antibiotic biosynthesis monooxygenase (ABM) superfamily enzyme
MEPEANKSTIAKAASDESLTSNTIATSFEDFVPPKAVKVLPPAKHKLWLIIWFLVYFATWVADEAELLDFLSFDGWLKPEDSLFLFLAFILFVLVYATTELFITVLTFETKSGTVYGVGAWLKQPRASWMYSHENIVFQVFARVIHIMEEGFSMFDAPPPVKEVIGPLQFDCLHGDCETSLKIEHRIKPDKVKAYQQWFVRIESACHEAPGLVAVEKLDLAAKVWDNEEGGLSAVSFSSKGGVLPDAQLHVIYLKFSTIHFLNQWMASPRRKMLMKALDPMLVQPDIVQIQSGRALPDTFSDLLTRQGEGVRESPPKKWKVWWLTLLALYISIRWADTFLPYYFEKWGLNEADPKLERLVKNGTTTLMNAYVMVPLFLFVFNHWLHSDNNDPKVVKNTQQPWKALDEGFTSIWVKLIMTIGFYGGCLIVSIVKKDM